jgi:hypothetical protein
MSNQLIQIKRSTDNKASLLSLNGGELAYSTAELATPHYTSGTTSHSEIWIGKATNLVGNPAGGEKIYSSDLMHAWDNDKFIMKDDGDQSALSLGVTNVTSLISSGGVSGTSGSFGTGAVEGGTGTFSAALQGTDLTVTSGAISGGTADLSLTSTTNKVKLNALTFDGSAAASGVSWDKFILQSDANGVFAPAALDITTEAQNAITGTTDQITVIDGKVAPVPAYFEGLAQNKIASAIENMPATDGDSEFNYVSGKWQFTPGRGISISEAANASDALSISQGVLLLDKTKIVANNATAVADGALDGHNPTFAGLALTAGTSESTPATFSVGAFTEVFFGDNELNNVKTPTLSHQAATKEYVDSVATGLGVKRPVQASSTVDLTLVNGLNATFAVGTNGANTFTGTGTLNLDGIPISKVEILTNGLVSQEADRVLVQHQTNQHENGIYELTSNTSGWVLTRATGSDAADELASGTFVFVEAGNSHVNKGYVISSTLATNASIGESPANIVWSLFSSTGVIEGDDLTTEKAGNEIKVKLAVGGAIDGSAGLKVNVVGDKGIIIGTGGALEVELSPNANSPLRHNNDGISILADSSMTIDADQGLGVNVDTDDLTKDGNGVGVNLNVAGGLLSSSNGIGVDLHTSGAIELSGNKLRIKADVAETNAIVVGDDGIRVTLRSAGSGLELSGVNTNDLGVKTGGIIESMIALGAVNLATKVSGVLPILNGGLGLSTVGNGILKGNGTGYEEMTGAEGSFMVMGAGNVPSFVTMDGGSF